MLSTDKLTELPLFPLGTVLFPGGLLPLRIFEVRYLDMIKKCHASGLPFGVVSLTQGTEVRRPRPEAAGDGFAEETFHPVGTLAHITEFVVPQPGLILIRCTGRQRFELTRSEKLRHGLWVADATLLPDDVAVPVPDDLQPVAAALKDLIDKLRQQSVPDDKMPLLMPYQLSDCGWVANRWSELLPIPVALKQQLMGLDNPLVRLELISDILDRSGMSR
jgi:Lon protease-like protein